MKHLLSIFGLVIPLIIFSLANIWGIKIPFDIMVIVMGITCFVGELIDPFTRTIDDQQEIDEEIINAFSEFSECAHTGQPEKKIAKFNCINCGAPIKLNYCEYCGTIYKETE